MRTRTFLDRAGRKKCPHITVVEKQKCMQPECSLADLEIPDPNCPLTPWSDWSPCSVTCGKGVQIRTRLLLVEPEKEAECRSKKELNQQRQCSTRQDCVFDFETAKQICSMEPDGGSCRGVYRRFYYDTSRQSCHEFEYGGCRGNQNNFLTSEICMSSCSLVRASVPSHRETERNSEQPITAAPRAQVTPRFQGREDSLPVDCVLSEWDEWSPCSVACGIGFSERTRRILKEARNGGQGCAKLMKRRRCNGTTCS